MAKINFTKGEKFYTAEFQINGPTAIHIERNKVGPLYLKQKSVENGQYDFVKDFGYNRGGDLTIDTAIQGVVYPMWIKIESASEPTLAEMVEGEQSGGGAGTESTIEYYSIDWDKAKELGYDGNDTTLSSYSGSLRVLMGASQTAVFLGKAVMLTSSMIISGYLEEGMVDRLQYQFPIITSNLDGELITCNTFNDILTKNVDSLSGILQNIDGIFVPITKEQFYSLEA